MSEKTRAGKAGRAASPWNRYPHCETHRAILEFSKGRKRREAAEAIAALRARDRKG